MIALATLTIGLFAFAYKQARQIRRDRSTIRRLKLELEFAEARTTSANVVLANVTGAMERLV